MREMRNARKILTGKPEWKRTLGRRRHRWENNIKMRLKNEEWECELDSFNGPRQSSGGILWTRKWTFRLCKRLGISYQLRDYQLLKKQGVSIFAPYSSWQFIRRTNNSSCECKTVSLLSAHNVKKISIKWRVEGVPWNTAWWEVIYWTIHLGT